MLLCCSAPWNVSSYWHSQSTVTKQNPSGTILNTVCGDPLLLSPSEIKCNDFQDIFGTKKSKDT